MGVRLPVQHRHDDELWSDVQHWLRYHDYEVKMNPWGDCGCFVFEVFRGESLVYYTKGKQLTKRLRELVKWMQRCDPEFNERNPRMPSGLDRNVERAKERLMDQYKIDEPQAHKFIRNIAMERRITMVDAANLVLREAATWV